MDSTHEDIYQQMVDAGVEIDHHESDLYAKKTEASQKIVEGYAYRSNVTTFKSAIDGEPWYDIPFAYMPWWTARGMG